MNTVISITAKAITGAMNDSSTTEKIQGVFTQLDKLLTKPQADSSPVIELN